MRNLDMFNLFYNALKSDALNANMLRKSDVYNVLYTITKINELKYSETWIEATHQKISEYDIEGLFEAFVMPQRVLLDTASAAESEIDLLVRSNIDEEIKAKVSEIDAQISLLSETKTEPDGEDDITDYEAEADDDQLKSLKAERKFWTGLEILDSTRFHSRMLNIGKAYADKKYQPRFTPITTYRVTKSLIEAGKNVTNGIAVKSDEGRNSKAMPARLAKSLCDTLWDEEFFMLTESVYFRNVFRNIMRDAMDRGVVKFASDSKGKNEG